MKGNLTILVEKGEDGWLVGQIEEYPAVISQGKTITELKGNLTDALKLYLDYQRDELKKQNKGKKLDRKKLIVSF